MKKLIIVGLLVISLNLTGCAKTLDNIDESNQNSKTESAFVSGEQSMINSLIESNEGKSNFMSDIDKSSFSNSDESKKSTGSDTPTKAIIASSAFLDEYDLKKDTLKMDIGCWFSPIQTDTAFKEYVDAGFNMVFLQGDNAGKVNEYDKAKQGLDLSAKYNLKAYLWADQRSLGSGVEFTYNYSGFPAFAGINYDEPNKSEILNKIAPNISRFNSMYINATMFLNLYPLRGIKVTGYDNYDDYINATYTNVLSKINGVRWLSVDDYPIMEQNKSVDGTIVREKYINDQWLRNIEYVAEFSKSHPDIKTHFFIQSMGYGSNNRQPSEADLRLQVYGLLAFGINSYSYFCYFTPPIGPEFSASQYAVINRDGSKSPLYDGAVKVNKEMLMFDHVYEQFKWKGVYCVETGERNSAFNNLNDSLNLSNLKNIKTLSADNDMLIGYFEDKNFRPGYILMNYNETTLDLTATLNMEFKNATRIAVYKNGIRTIYEISKNTYKISLKAGEGAFVIPF